MNKDVQRFDRWSSTYERCWCRNFFGRVHQLMLEMVAAEAPGWNPSTVLDVGCGTGKLLRRTKGRWPAAQMVGIDPAPGMIEVARSLMPEGSFHQAYAESVPLPDASADLVLSSVSMHHWQDSATGVGEVARVLRPAGLFCLADLALPAWLAKLARSKAKSRPGIRHLLAEAGFEVGRQQAVFARLVLISLAKRQTCSASRPAGTSTVTGSR